MAINLHIPQRKRAALLLVVAITFGVYVAINKFADLQDEFNKKELLNALAIFLAYCFTVFRAWGDYRRAIFWEDLRDSTKENGNLVREVENGIETAESLFGFNRYLPKMLWSLVLGAVLGLALAIFSEKFL